MTKAARSHTCFVIMGFGIKTDYITGRKLDLNKSYDYLIKPVIQRKQMVCTRADEIYHSGSIDLQMYIQLLNSDIVIADLSTGNLNSFYELGVRHALRPFSTIVIAEDKFQYPFDIAHLKIMKYSHLGSGIDFAEVLRFQRELESHIDFVLKKEQPDFDSPVYTYLKGLTPPTFSVLKKQDPESKCKDYIAEKILRITYQAESAFKSQNYDKARMLFRKAIDLNSSSQK